MIYMAGIWRETIGFAAMVMWMMGVSVGSAVLLAWVATRYKRECDSSASA